MSRKFLQKLTLDNSLKIFKFLKTTSETHLCFYDNNSQKNNILKIFIKFSLQTTDKKY